MNPNDNINERYQAFEKKPGSMKKALAYFYNVTEDSFDAFREVVQNLRIVRIRLGFREVVDGTDAAPPANDGRGL